MDVQFQRKGQYLTNGEFHKMMREKHLCGQRSGPQIQTSLVLRTSIDAANHGRFVLSNYRKTNMTLSQNRLSFIARRAVKQGANSAARSDLALLKCKITTVISTFKRKDSDLSNTNLVTYCIH